MADTFVTDITHFPSPCDVAPPSAHRMARFFGGIVSAASLQPKGDWVVVPIECRRRPDHMPCSGFIRVRTTDEPVVEWHCTSCGDNGFISSWQGTSWDLGSMLEETDRDGRRFKMRLSLSELRAAKASLLIDSECHALLASAVVVQGDIWLQAAASDFDLLADNLAAEANHSPRKRQRILDGMIDRIEDLVRRSSP